MRALGFLIATCVLGAPSLASANELIQARYFLTEEDAALSIVSHGPLQTDRVRSDSGVIRIWFSGIDQNPRLDPVVDGRALRSIRVRAGANGTAVLTMQLGDRRTVPTEAIRVEHIGPLTHVRIARTELPAPLAEEAPAAEEATAAGTPVDAAPDQGAESDDATESAEPAVADAPLEPAGTAFAPARGQSSPPAPPRMAEGGPTMSTLLLVTLLLGALYLGVRIVFGKGRRSSPLSGIEVVSSKRLGARHQLVLVRALGQDHLLSVNGNQTQRIASLPSSHRATEDVEEAPASGMLARLQNKLRQPGRTEPSQSAPNPADKPKASIFGAELLRFSEEAERRRPRAESVASSTSNTEESVAGILRLRERSAR